MIGFVKDLMGRGHRRMEAHQRMIDQMEQTMRERQLRDDRVMFEFGRQLTAERSAFIAKMEQLYEGGGRDGSSSSR